ncbi:MAG TPA: hypothetical protein VFM74_06500 [Candidatus Limnocylindria bacterium]|nr:hypothetical protein [Candidatus Limnocylindria bacterium]
MANDVATRATRFPILASCDRRGDGYRCSVQIGDDPAATHHEIAFTAAELDRLAPDGTKPEELARVAFRFLLRQEPREAILRDFELQVIGRYFPGWEEAIAAEFGRDRADQ